MVAASVGFQCPSCVKEGSATVRPKRTAYGALVRNPGRVTNTLIALNVAVFVLIHVTGGSPSPTSAGSVWLRRFWELPWFPSGAYDSVAGGAYWQLVTSMFTHVEVTHILLNMLSLWIVGTQLELLLGWWRYLAVYLVSGLVGNVAVYWFSAAGSPGNPGAPSLGASGAIFGVFACLIVLALRMGIDISQMLVILGLNLALTFTVANISWQAHLGGLLAGLAMGAGIGYLPAARRRIGYPAMFAGLVVLCVLATVVRTAQLPAVSG